MLTYASDLLFKIYEEEGYSPTEIPSLILENNLFGTELDDRAGSLAAFALSMKAREKQNNFFNKTIQPNICVLKPIHFTEDELDELACSEVAREDEQQFWNQFEHADLFGSLILPNEELLPILKTHLENNVEDTLSGAKTKAEQTISQAEYLTQRYQVVVANPPYMGNKNVNSNLSEFIGNNFQDVKSDLFSAFTYRAIDFVTERGQIGIMTPFVWMFLSSYEQMRKRLLKEETITSLIQLEYSGFDGATVPICSFTFEKSHKANYRAGFVRLSDFKGSQNQAPRALEAIKNQRLSWFYRTSSAAFESIPGSPIAYWLSQSMLDAFSKGQPLSEIADPKVGLQTGDNERFLRQWYEIGVDNLGMGMTSREEASSSGRKWFPCNKGGNFRRWYGNQEYVVNWESDGKEIVEIKPRSVIRNPTFYFKESASWSRISSGAPAFRYFPKGSIFDVNAPSVFVGREEGMLMILGFANSNVAFEILKSTSPTLSFQVGAIAGLPVISAQNNEAANDVLKLIEISKSDWDFQEISWGFSHPSIRASDKKLRSAVNDLYDESIEISELARVLETKNNQYFTELYSLDGELEYEVPIERISLLVNSRYERSTETSNGVLKVKFTDERVEELLSYFVGCLFGRYSLDEPGLVLASQGGSLEDYLAKVSDPSFTPDKDNVVPVLNGEWFEDDIVSRFHQFLRAGFGEEHFEENLRFIEDTLGKPVRDHFVKDFYKDHVQRYKKRPIYWMFSSPSGSFNALIYVHRYNPSTVSTVLNEYLREFQTKLEAEQRNQEQLTISVDGSPRDKARAQKEVEKIRKMLTELKDYERDVLYPLATQQKEIDLDDGVLVNYLRFGKALAPIKEIEKKRSDVEKWEWPTNKLEPTDE
ncbi:MAG: BREX-1 system adenine-specific DNA-methyltransferase PglX [Acidimicrobiia bacterium]